MTDPCVWLRQWAGDDEPKWGPAPTPVGYAYRATPSEVRDGSWLTPLRRAVTAAYRSQFPNQLVLDVSGPFLHCYADTTPTWWHHNRPEFRYGQPDASHVTVQFSVTRTALLLTGSPTAEQAARPADWATLRWYDVDLGASAGWFRRCVVWRYTVDPARNTTVGTDDPRFVWRYKAGINRTAYADQHRRDVEMRTQTITEHQFWPGESHADLVRAVHFGTPDWIPDRPRLPDRCRQLLYDLVGPSGTPTIRDDNHLDRMFGRRMDLSAWTEVSDLNPNSPVRDEFIGYTTDVQGWRWREIADDIL